MSKTAAEKVIKSVSVDKKNDKDYLGLRNKLSFIYFKPILNIFFKKIILVLSNLMIYNCKCKK